MSDVFVIDDQEFAQYQRFLYQSTGIHLSEAKRPLVTSRLAKRLRECGMGSYGQYLRLLTSGEDPQEHQHAIDLLTTNETYFFREPKHFDFLRERVLSKPRLGETFRVWSAASSTGEEAYSIAMLLADQLKSSSWEIIGTDISTRVLEKAREGIYPLERASHIPKDYLTRFCLRGVGPQKGSFRIEKSLRKRVKFLQANLNAPLPDMGRFDVIFLRNVMIYFDAPTKEQVVRRVIPHIRDAGYLLIGHSENLTGIAHSLKVLGASTYQKI